MLRRLGIVLLLLLASLAGDAHATLLWGDAVRAGMSLADVQAHVPTAVVPSAPLSTRWGTEGLRLDDAEAFDARFTVSFVFSTAGLAAVVLRPVQVPDAALHDQVYAALQRAFGPPLLSDGTRTAVNGHRRIAGHSTWRVDGAWMEYVVDIGTGGAPALMIWRREARSPLLR